MAWKKKNTTGSPNFVHYSINFRGSGNRTSTLEQFFSLKQIYYKKRQDSFRTSFKKLCSYWTLQFKKEKPNLRTHPNFSLSILNKNKTIQPISF